MAPKLERTKSLFKLTGNVSRLGDKSYREGVSKNGSEWRSIRFSVQTSPTNEVTVELFGIESDTVFSHNKKEKKTLKHPWVKRSDALPDGYELIGNHLGLVKDDKGKNIKTILVNYDAVDYIKKNLQNGDSVWLSGEIEFGTYEKDGKTRPQTRYVLKQVYKTSDPVDFTAEGFEETSAFSQGIVINDVEKDSDTGKVLVHAYTINYKDKDTNKPVATNGLEINPETHPKLASKFLTLKYGDFVEVVGNVRNEAVIEEAPEEEEEDEWGSTRPSGFENRGVKHTVSALVITGVTPGSYEEKKYTEDDLTADAVEETFGKTSNDPFADDDDDSLPFRN